MASRMRALTREADTRRRQAGERAGELEGTVDERRASFDGREYLADTTGALFEQFQEGFGENLERYRGQQVGQGRFDTGFRFEGEDRLFRDMSRDLNREVASRALTAAGLDLRNTEGMSADAGQDRAVYDASLSGAMDRETAELNARDQRKRNRLGLLGSIAGGVGGFFLGGPAGAKLGAGLGGRLGDLI